MGKILRSMTGVFSVLFVASGLMAAMTMVQVVAPAGAATLPTCAVRIGATHVGRFLGILRPQLIAGGRHASCRPGAATNGSNSPLNQSSPPYVGSPPLQYNGGPVMATPAVGDKVVVTPIFWAPSGYSIDSSYESLIDKFISDVAASNTPNDVFGVLQQYYESTNTHIHSSFAAGTPIVATNSFPAEGCTPDGGPIYADNSGYTYCLDDTQLQSEISTETSSLPADMGHIYALFTPKHVEVCFTTSDGAQGGPCTINANSATAGGFCAYHSNIGGNLIYAAMPYTVYQSPIGYTCGTDGGGLGIQSPNGNTDGDQELSAFSHEVSESVTDPTGQSWYDSQGNEIGDDCAYIFGAVAGSSGAEYNQTINGDHYIIQEEFSNENFVANTSGCVQGATLPVADFSVTTASPKAGQPVSFSGSSSSVPVPGGPNPPSITSYSWSFGDGHTGTGETPSHTYATSGDYTVSLQVTDSDGWTSTTFQGSVVVGGAPGPTVTSVTPNKLARGVSKHSIVVTGSGFASGATLSDSEAGVTFSSTVVNSSTRITAKVSIAKSAALGKTSVTVANPGGSNGTCTGCLAVDARPTISSLSLKSIAAGSTKTVTVKGSGFESGAKLAFSGSGVSVTIVSISATAIKIQVKVLGSAAHSSRNLTVTNPDGGSAEKSGALTVT